MKVLKSKYLSHHPYFTAREDAYELASGKIVDPYFVVEMPPSACALALTAENKVLFVKQYRYPVNEELFELPGGFIDRNEPAELAIRRELKEETGYDFTTVLALGNTFANPGVLNNKTFLFLCLGGELKGEQSLDDNEEIAIHLKELHVAKEMLMRGDIKQSLHAVCMYRAFDYLAEHYTDLQF